MVSPRTAQRLETLIWVLIYGGLLAATLGLFTREADRVTGAWLIASGSLMATVGVVLIGVRSRLTVAPDVPPSDRPAP